MDVPVGPHAKAGQVRADQELGPGRISRKLRRAPASSGRPGCDLGHEQLQFVRKIRGPALLPGERLAQPRTPPVRPAAVGALEQARKQRPGGGTWDGPAEQRIANLVLQNRAEGERGHGRPTLPAAALLGRT